MNDLEKMSAEEVKAALHNSGDGYTPRGEPNAGWVRIGRYDRARRRSLWSRITTSTGEEPCLNLANVTRIELCAGREGDDAYAAVTPDNPVWGELLDVVLYAEGNLPTDESDEPPPSEPERPRRELLCERCQADYPVWVAPNWLWNEVTEEHNEHFLCPRCFAVLAEERGVEKPTAWVLLPESDDLAHRLLPRERPSRGDALREVAEQAEVLYEGQRLDAAQQGDVQGEQFWASHRDTVRHALQVGPWPSGVDGPKAAGVGAPDCTPLADRAATSAADPHPSDERPFHIHEPEGEPRPDCSCSWCNNGRAYRAAHRPSEARPLPPEVVLFNGGQRCDVICGACSCGATHTMTEWPERLSRQRTNEARRMYCSRCSGLHEHAEHCPDEARPAWISFDKGGIARGIFSSREACEEDARVYGERDGGWEVRGPYVLQEPRPEPAAPLEAIATDTPTFDHVDVARLGAQIEALQAHRRESPEPFLEGELVCIGRDPETASEFYGGLGVIIGRRTDVLGNRWGVQMIEPYRNARYVFRAAYLMRVCKPSESSSEGEP